ncbi:MAG: SDR family NAD(P)-dependent oxidoreductase [Spirochaetota bacterium]
MQIKDSTALVTGANRGIGYEITQALVAAGAKKVYAGMRQTNGFQSSDSRIEAIELDVTKPENVATASQVASDVNLLINNAGVLDFGDILQASPEVLQRNLAVNLFGKLDVSQQFVPIIKQNGGGAIANVLTLVALASMPGLSVYNASKAAAWSMSLSLRASLNGSGIEVHNVFPGAVDTDMLAGVEMEKTSAKDVAKAIVGGIGDGQEDIFPDPMSKSVYQEWRRDHKAIEKQFANM